MMRTMRAVVALACLAAFFSGCESGNARSPCQMACEKQNGCGQATPALPCAQVCVYGGNYYEGFGPSPYCPNLQAQTACVQAAVDMSCNDWKNAIIGCPACPPLT